MALQESQYQHGSMPPRLLIRQRQLTRNFKLTKRCPRHTDEGFVNQEVPLPDDANAECIGRIAIAPKESHHGRTVETA